MRINDKPLTLGHKLRVKIRQLIVIVKRYLIDEYVWEIRLFRLSFVHHVKCFAVFWKLPNVIHGTEQLLIAEILEHKDTKDTLSSAQWRLDHLIECSLDKLPLDATGKKICPKTAKEFYQQLDMEVPDKYLTDDEVWDRDKCDYDEAICHDGIPDDVEIINARYEGRKLLGIQSEMVLQYPKEHISYQYYKEVLSIKNGGWDISRNNSYTTLGGGWKNV